MLSNSSLSLLTKISKNLFFSTLCFMFVLLSGLALMKVLSVTMAIPELRVAKQFSAMVYVQIFGYSVVGLLGVYAAIKAETYRKQ